MIVSIFSLALSKPYLTGDLNPTIPSVLYRLSVLAAYIGQQLCQSKQARSGLVKQTGALGDYNTNILISCPNAFGPDAA